MTGSCFFLLIIDHTPLFLLVNNYRILFGISLFESTQLRRFTNFERVSFLQSSNKQIKWRSRPKTFAEGLSKKRLMWYNWPQHFVLHTVSSFAEFRKVSLFSFLFKRHDHPANYKLAVTSGWTLIDIICLSSEWKAWRADILNLKN